MMSSTRFDLVANAIPGVEELTCITQRNSRTAITHVGVSAFSIQPMVGIRQAHANHGL